MVKISKKTDQHKHAGPAEEPISKSNPRRKAARKRPSEPAVAVGESTVQAAASMNPRQQMPLTGDGRSPDTFTADEQGGDKADLPGRLVSDRLESDKHEPVQPVPQPEPRPLLAGQGTAYRPASPDDCEDAWPEAVEPVGDSTGNDDEDPDFADDGEYSDDGDQDEDSDNYITDEIEGSEYGDDEEYSNDGEDDEDCLDDDDQQEPARQDGPGSGHGGPVEQEPIKIRWLMKKLKNPKRIRGTFVYAMVREIVDSGDEAMVLGQIMFWFDHGPNGQPRCGALKKGKRWLYKSHADFLVELGIPERRIRRCLDKLENAGFIERDYFRANGQRTTHIRLNVTAVYEAMLKIHQKRREKAGATETVARCD